MKITTPTPRPDLRKRRRLLGLSQTDLANKLRVTTAAVSSWESGTRRPGDRLIPALAQELKLDPAALLPLIDGESTR